MDYLIRRIFVWLVVASPVAAWAQSSTIPAGLNKPVQTLTTLQTVLISASVILLTIALIGTGVSIMYYKKRWEDISQPVIGGIIVGIAPALAAWLIN